MQQYHEKSQSFFMDHPRPSELGKAQFSADMLY